MLKLKTQTLGPAGRFLRKFKPSSYRSADKSLARIDHSYVKIKL